MIGFIDTIINIGMGLFVVLLLACIIGGIVEWIIEIKNRKLK